MYDIRMKDFIEKHSLLYSSQYGFRQAHSTQYGMYSFHSSRYYSLSYWRSNNDSK